eukprot:NODE_575_length_1352_cov_56.083265_g537_i0.p1 GENE.NODE_575_length_1352_cov_56.083265_g537_i0~~NODE_575_length_1352_cov_56.083265_g537_i0.p1  ORF type:complete len:414 (-),score=48.37 NODE_575_length_1352_cov_56.083265_g537_i0:52-1293(-)
MPPHTPATAGTAAASGPSYITVDSKRYDTAKLAALHPGGEFMVNLFDGNDATLAFQSYHRRGFPHEAYKACLVTDQPSQTEKYPSMDSHKELCDKIRPYVTNGGFAPWWYHVKVAFLMFTAIGIELYMLMYGRSWFWATVWGLIGSFIGLNVQHDANHGSVSKDPRINRLYGLAQDYLGGNAISWSLNHNVFHHVHTNDPALDDDLAVPGLRLHKSFPWMLPHAFQHFYMILLEAFFGVFHMAWSCFQIFLGRGIPEKLVPFLTVSRLVLSCSLVLRVLIPLYMEPGWATALGIFYQINFGGLYLAFFFLLSHNFVGVQFRTSSDGDWAQNQVETSSNLCGPVLAFMNGGLNYQIEHHLFPRIHHSHYSKIAPVVRKYAEDKGWQYVHFDTVLANLRSTLAHLQQLGHNPKAE